MKRVAFNFVAFALSAGAALAADLPARKAELPPLPPLPALPSSPTWAGMYLGLNAGGTFGVTSSLSRQTWNLYPAPDNVSYTSATQLSGPGSNNGGGFIGGGQFGYNWQIDGWAFVAGLEADFQGVAGGSGAGSPWTAVPMDMLGVPYTHLNNQQSRSRLDYIGTVRGRVGFLVMPTLLVYGTGGLAYGGVNASLRNVQLWTGLGSAAGEDYLNAGGGNYSSTLAGWTAGGGVEWMFMPNWSVKAEYLYFDLGRASGAVVNNYHALNHAPGGNGVESVTHYSGRINGQMARAGVNYHFDWGAPAPVVASF